LLAAATVCFMTVPANAAGGPEIASMNAGATALVWQPAVAYERMVLTVSGPGGVFTREFDGATAPSLGIYDSAGYPLADGGYNWELHATPVLGPGLRAQLARARKTGDESQVEALRQSGLLPSEPMVLSGHFRIHEGAFVRGDLDESEAGAAGPRSASAPVRSTHAADQVIPDDLIVQMSLCVGFDCVNNEPFGFDTIRLKENNLRILFMDTSVGTFPSRDWQLVANDSANGGANRFSIEDVDGGVTPFTVTAGAASNSIFVSSASRVGLRTSTPVLDLHIVTGNTPAIRLEQNGSSGFTPQTWDIAGNEANFFVRDVTGGSTLPFRIEPGTASSTVYLDSNERVGIGTAAPTDMLHVRSTGGVASLLVEEASATLDNNRVLLEAVNNGRAQFRLRNTADATGLSWFVSHETNGNFAISREGTGVAEVTVEPNGDLIITGNYTPDYVFEPDYELMPLSELADFVTRERHLPNVPNAVEVEKNGINVNDFPMALLEKIEELTLYTIDQHEQLTSLGAENSELKARLEALERLVVGGAVTASH
jgi:hypothetical protein